jgi:hypothetical protein
MQGLSLTWCLFRYLNLSEFVYVWLRLISLNVYEYLGKDKSLLKIYIIGTLMKFQSISYLLSESGHICWILGLEFKVHSVRFLWTRCGLQKCKDNFFEVGPGGQSFWPDSWKIYGDAHGLWVAAPVLNLSGDPFPKKLVGVAFSVQLRLQCSKFYLHNLKLIQR